MNMGWIALIAALAALAAASFTWTFWSLCQNLFASRPEAEPAKTEDTAEDRAARRQPPSR